MNSTPIKDNIYPDGTLIRAKADPGLGLVVVRYYHRIYYCAVAGNPDHKHFAYFEREIEPSGSL